MNTRTYEKFTSESELKNAVDQINKTRKKKAFFATEAPVRIRTFQASGSYECGFIEFCNGIAIGAEWNFKAYF
jgi:hypothetical protein